MRDEERRQRDYYARTADRYDGWHVHPGDEHERALLLMDAHAGMLGLESLLDVGTGTGRALSFFAGRRPGMALRGLEPVPELIDLAVEKGVPRQSIDAGTGQAMPYADGSFDAVCEVGVLHHVPDPEAVVREMTRVARRAVFLSDNNCYGWGGTARSLVKNGLRVTRLWRPALALRTRGRGYAVTEDDGVAWSYSVFDSLPLLRAWADEVVVIPTLPEGGAWRAPIVTAPHAFVAALRAEPEPAA